jgi:hypothetical protein
MLALALAGIAAFVLNLDQKLGAYLARAEVEELAEDKRAVEQAFSLYAQYTRSPSIATISHQKLKILARAHHRSCAQPDKPRAPVVHSMLRRRLPKSLINTLIATALSSSTKSLDSTTF